MDLEGLARDLYNQGKKDEDIIKELNKHLGSERKCRAILEEIKNTEHIRDDFVRQICEFPRSSVTANDSGLGCRGTGDFYVHRMIARMIGDTKAEVDPMAQDDGGAVKFGKEYLVTAVDGMHSRLSHFPFLAGFHATRAAIRDLVVMGATPSALFSDVHVACDGDVGKVFDYTAGLTTVSELIEVPLICGSTLRIGGDMVLGDRLTGCVGAMGQARKLTSRKKARIEDILIMTEGSGGGTIASTALFNGREEVVKETLNIDTIKMGISIVQSDMLDKINGMTDVTNGGLRGDAFEISRTAEFKVELYDWAIESLVNEKVLEMLKSLDIDHLGVSIDSLLLTTRREDARSVLDFIGKNGGKADIVGEIKEGRGVFLKSEEGELNEIYPDFREAPYTPIKRIVDQEDSKSEIDQRQMEKKIEAAIGTSISKKNMLKQWISNRSGK